MHRDVTLQPTIDEPVIRLHWARTAPARPLSEQQLVGPDLMLSLHGPGRLGLKKSHHDDIEGDPYYAWSGTCAGSWAVSVRHRRWFVDLGRGGRIRWCTRQSGRNHLHAVIKPVAGPWLISEQSVGAGSGWRETEMPVGDLSWQELDIDAVRVAGRVASPRLECVDAIGFADLAASAGSDACSRLAWMEAWGGAVARTPVLES